MNFILQFNCKEQNTKFHFMFRVGSLSNFDKRFKIYAWQVFHEVKCGFGHIYQRSL